MTYDVNGNLTSVSPPTRPAHPFNYNLIDLLIGNSAPEVGGSTRATTFDYDADQALTKATRPSGDEVDLNYDAAGRLSEVTSPDGANDFEYNAGTGQLDSATSDDAQQAQFEFDGPLTERIEASGAANGAIAFSYDNDLRTSAITTPGGATALTYDDDSLLTQAGAMALTRSPASGQLTATSLASTTSTRAYNTFGEPTQEATTYPSGSYQESYTRDALGRITTRTESSSAGTKTYAYSYDPAGRLTQVTLNSNPYRAFAYDANGNRTSSTKQTPSGPVTQTATYDAQDRQTTSGDHALTYNDNGELTAKTNTQSGETLALQYKTSGDLAKATTPDGRQLTYEYDAFGNRMAELEDGALKAAYLYAPGISNPIAKVDQSGTEEARYIYATRSHVPDFIVQGSTTYRLITDQMGSIRQVVNASTGVVAQEITYDPFGEILSDSNPGFQPFGFAGGLYDSDTKLTHFGAREYDAELGRWTSSDPIGFAGGDTNLYGYVVQDPVNLIDPSGMLFKKFTDSPYCYAVPIACGPMKGYEAVKGFVAPKAESAQGWAAEKAFDPSSNVFEKGLGWAVGMPSSLLTCENFDETALTVATGGRAAAASPATKFAGTVAALAAKQRAKEGAFRFNVRSYELVKRYQKYEKAIDAAKEYVQLVIKEMVK